MKIIYSLLCLILIFSCNAERKDYLEREIKNLEIRKSELENEIYKLEMLQKVEIDNIPEQAKKYFVLLEVKQSRTFGILDTENYIKDEINKFTIPLEVSSSYYNSVTIGSNIKNEFRIGSFILKGSMSSWKIIVKEKHIKY